MATTIDTNGKKRRTSSDDRGNVLCQISLAQAVRTEGCFFLKQVLESAFGICSCSCGCRCRCSFPLECATSRASPYLHCSCSRGQRCQKAGEHEASPIGGVLNCMTDKTGDAGTSLPCVPRVATGCFCHADGGWLESTGPGQPTLNRRSRGVPESVVGMLLLEVHRSHLHQ